MTDILSRSWASRGRSTLLWAFLLGLAAATGFQPLNLWPVTLVAIAILMAQIMAASTSRRALAIGWWFGIGHFVLGLNWIATAFTYQAAMPAWLGWIAVVLLSLYLAIYPALAVAAGWVLGRGNPARLALVFAAFWMAAEWLRGTLFTGFAWNPLGAVLLPLLPIAESARWFGGLGLSGVAILLSALPLLLIGRRWKALAVFALVPIVLVGTGLAWLQAPIEPDGLRVRIVQPNIGQEEKWAEGKEADIERRFVMLSGKPDKEPRLLLWPEASVRAYLEEEPKARARLARLLGPRDLLLTGGVALVWSKAGDVIAARNSMFVLDAGGTLVGRYDKAHLVPYGEYLPMRPLLSAIGLSRLAPGDLDFRPGPGPRTVVLPGFGSVGTQICYEIIFAGHVVDRSVRPRFLFNPSNDAWFGSWGPPQHLAQARLRAIEEGVPIARSTPTGISAVIDPLGRVTAALPYKKAGVIDAVMPAPLPLSPFARFGPWLSGAFAILLLITGLIFTARKAF